MDSTQGDEALIDPQEACARFDAAVADLQITYAPTDPVLLSDNGFEFEFRICPQWSQKPQLPSEAAPSKPGQSDIRQPRSLHIAAIKPAHNLTFNAYPVLRPSYLLLTSSATHHQSSPLSLDDIEAGRRVLHGLGNGPIQQISDGSRQAGSEYMLIYNGGRDAGCSRLHKHMQLLPRPTPNSSSFTLFPDRPSQLSLNVPYVYELFRHVSAKSISAGQEFDICSYIYAAYVAALSRFRVLLGRHDSVEPIAHNVIMTKEWTVVIPRRLGRVEGVSANAMGMMGMVWVGKQAELDEWRHNGASRLLGELGVSKKDHVPCRITKFGIESG